MSGSLPAAMSVAMPPEISQMLEHMLQRGGGGGGGGGGQDDASGTEGAGQVLLGHLDFGAGPISRSAIFRRALVDTAGQVGGGETQVVEHKVNVGGIGRSHTEIMLWNGQRLRRRGMVEKVLRVLPSSKGVILSEARTATTSKRKLSLGGGVSSLASPKLNSSISQPGGCTNIETDPIPARQGGQRKKIRKSSATKQSATRSVSSSSAKPSVVKPSASGLTLRRTEPNRSKTTADLRQKATMDGTAGRGAIEDQDKKPVEKNGTREARSRMEPEASGTSPDLSARHPINDILEFQNFRSLLEAVHTEFSGGTLVHIQSQLDLVRRTCTECS